MRFGAKLTFRAFIIALRQNRLVFSVSPNLMFGLFVYLTPGQGYHYENESTDVVNSGSWEYETGLLTVRITVDQSITVNWRIAYSSNSIQIGKCHFSQSSMLTTKRHATNLSSTEITFHWSSLAGLKEFESVRVNVFFPTTTLPISALEPTGAGELSSYDP